MSKIKFKRIGTPQESRLTRQWQYVDGLSKYQYKDWIITNQGGCGWEVYKGDEWKLFGSSYKDARQFVINQVQKHDPS